MNPNINPCGAGCPEYAPGKECDCSKRQTYMIAKERKCQEQMTRREHATFRKDASKYAENRRKRGE